MTPELIAIISIGVALAALILRQSFRIDGLGRNLNARIDTLTHDLNARIDTLAHDLNARIDTLAHDLNARIDGLAHDIADMRERLARLEGLIEGLFQPRPVTTQPPRDQHDEAA